MAAELGRAPCLSQIPEGNPYTCSISFLDRLRPDVSWGPHSPGLPLARVPKDTVCGADRLLVSALFPPVG